jgi:hypothetical protein
MAKQMRLSPKERERIRERDMQKHRDNQSWRTYKPKLGLSVLIF